jgi:hypothetical protein
MLQVLASSNLMHQFVLVSVHTRKLTDMVEGIQDTVCKLEGVDVSKSVLNLGINNKLCQSQDFSHQMESVSETGLLSLLGSKSLDRLQIKVVIQVKICQVLAMDEKVEHVETLAADLQTSLDPINGSLLEEFGLLKRPHQILLVLRLGLLLMKFVQDEVLKKLLV